MVTKSTVKKLKSELVKRGFFSRVPVTNPKYASVKHEAMLWRTVLDRALADLFDPNEQNEVICWLLNDYAKNEEHLEGSFEAICEWSLLPKDVVYTKFMEVLFLLENKNGKRFDRRIRNTLVFPET